MIEFNRQAETVAEYYGLEHQMCIVQEECAELIQALSKLRRAMNTGMETPEHRIMYTVARGVVAEELADVINMTKQLMYLMNNEATVRFWLKQKLDKKISEIEKERENEDAGTGRRGPSER